MCNFGHFYRGILDILYGGILGIFDIFKGNFGHFSGKFRTFIWEILGHFYGGILDILYGGILGIFLVIFGHF